MGDKSEDHSLPQHLRDEAAAERPAFSSEVHRRIMQRINCPGAENRSLIWRISIAAAAGFFIGASLCVFRMKGTHQRPLAQHPSEIANVSPAPLQAHLPAGWSIALPLSINIGSVVSATFEPTDVTLKLLSPGQGDSYQSQPLETPQDNPAPTLASPQWLLAYLEQPANQAQSLLADVVPAGLPSNASVNRH